MSVPLELAALRGLLAHGCFSCFWTGEQGPGEDRCQVRAPVLPGSDPPSRLQRALSSREELGAGRAASGPGSSPHRPPLFITHRKKTTSLKIKTREAEGALCWLQALCPVDLRARCGSGAPGSLLQTLTRLQQLLLGSFSLLYFSLICQVFFLS